MTQYSYPIVTTGYRWNLLKRCLWEIGIEPTCIGDMSDQTYLQFSRDLSANEKSILDTIMSGDAQNPPSTGVRLTIKDLWGGTNSGENFEAFRTACGLPNLRLYYTESVAGSGVFDRVTLWHPTPLTTSQKNAVKAAFANMYLG